MEVVRAEHVSRADVAEIHSPTTVVKEAVSMGTRLGFLLGSPASKTGGGICDFGMGSCRREALKCIIEARPLCVVGLPPCTPWSTLQNLGAGTEAARRRIERDKERGRIYFDFCAMVYNLQRRHGRYFS